MIKHLISQEGDIDRLKLLIYELANLKACPNTGGRPPKKPCISKFLYLFIFCLLISIKFYTFTDKSL